MGSDIRNGNGDKRFPHKVDDIRKQLGVDLAIHLREKLMARNIPFMQALADTVTINAAEVALATQAFALRHGLELDRLAIEDAFVTYGIQLRHHEALLLENLVLARAHITEHLHAVHDKYKTYAPSLAQEHIMSLGK